MNKKILIPILIAGAVLIAVIAVKEVRDSNPVSDSVQNASSTDEAAVEGHELPSSQKQSQALMGSDASAIKWSVGEKVGNFTVVSIAPRNKDFELGGFNVSVVFTGRQPIEGTIESTEMLGPVMHISESFKGVLPCGSAPSSNSRCGSVTIANFGDLGFGTLTPGSEPIKIKGTVTTYTYTSYPSEGAPSVILTDVVKETQ